MAITLAIFSAMFIALCMYGASLPDKLIELVRSFMSGPGLWAAVAIRLLLAALLWLTAPISHTPTTFKVLAVLVFVAAVILPIIGTYRLVKFIDRLASWPRLAIRLQCLLGVAFGAFLLWSVSPGIGTS